MTGVGRIVVKPRLYDYDFDAAAGRSAGVLEAWRERLGGVVGQLPRLTFIGVAGGVVVAGLVMRLVMVFTGGLNSDEAVVGIAANGILHGHLPVFFPGQAYGGVEPYAVASLFAAFGHDAVLINLTPAVLSVGAAVLTGGLAWVIFGRVGVAFGAGALAWIWPESAVWNATRELGFRGVAQLAGLTVLVASVVIVRRGPTTRLVGVLGMAAGIGWWASPEMLYYFVPAALFLGLAIVRWQLRLTLRQWAVLVVATASSSMPWWVANAHSGFASLGVKAQSGPGTYWWRLGTFFTKTLPMDLGLRVEGSGRWLGVAGVDVAVIVVMALATTLAVVALVMRGPREALLPVGFVLAFPFISAGLAPTSFWVDGRFAVFFPAILGVVLLGGWGLILSQRPAPVAPFLAACAIGLAGLLTFAAFEGTFAEVAPSNTVLSSVTSMLEAHHLRDVVGSYWTAYDVDFESGGAIAATPLTTVRLPSIARKVLADPGAAWLFVGTAEPDRALAEAQFGEDQVNPLSGSLVGFELSLERANVAFKTVDMGPMVAVIPDGFTPRQVLTAIGSPITVSVSAGG